jgi:hypothetical protein
MHRTILTLMFTSALILGTLCEAGPRKPAPAPAASNLTQMEEICYIVGDIAKNSAKMRDAGLSYLDAVQLMRQVSTKTPVSGEWGVWFTTSILGNLRWVYEHPWTSVQQVRNDTELACLRIAEQHGIVSPTAVKDRY